MSLRHWLLAAAAATVTASLVARSRRSGVTLARGIELPMGEGAGAEDAGLGASSAGTALNPAEQLRDSQSLGSPMAPGSPLAEASATDELFDSSSQRGSSTPVMTGLPDFSRGA